MVTLFFRIMIRWIQARENHWWIFENFIWAWWCSRDSVFQNEVIKFDCWIGNSLYFIFMLTYFLYFFYRIPYYGYWRKESWQWHGFNILFLCRRLIMFCCFRILRSSPPYVFFIYFKLYIFNIFFYALFY